MQDAGERTQRRSDILLHIQGLMMDLGIGYQLPSDHKLVSKFPLRDPVNFQSRSLQVNGKKKGTKGQTQEQALKG